MVRFIIIKSFGNNNCASIFTFQYGQIYYKRMHNKTKNNKINLHSNMVRFIIYLENSQKEWEKKFTFQYGQIYYFKYSIDRHRFSKNLHSNMVRFIIGFRFPTFHIHHIFTFQYGQIYYVIMKNHYDSSNNIYIPIWLDLLLILFLLRIHY